MARYLFDTSALSALLSAKNPNHEPVVEFNDHLGPEAESTVSAVALAELRFGMELASAFTGQDLPALADMIAKAEANQPLAVDTGTARAYAKIKTGVAKTYLDKANRRDRPKHVENWIDKNTGERLGIDENDLWMCAQALQYDMTFVTTDKRIGRIAAAEPALKLTILGA